MKIKIASESPAPPAFNMPSIMFIWFFLSVFWRIFSNFQQYGAIFSFIVKYFKFKHKANHRASAALLFVRHDRRFADNIHGKADGNLFLTIRSMM